MNCFWHDFNMSQQQNWEIGISIVCLHIWIHHPNSLLRSRWWRSNDQNFKSEIFAESNCYRMVFWGTLSVALTLFLLQMMPQKTQTWIFQIDVAACLYWCFALSKFMKHQQLHFIANYIREKIVWLALANLKMIFVLSNNTKFWTTSFFYINDTELSYIRLRWQRALGKASRFSGNKIGLVPFKSIRAVVHILLKNDRFSAIESDNSQKTKVGKPCDEKRFWKMERSNVKRFNTPNFDEFFLNKNSRSSTDFEVWTMDTQKWTLVHIISFKTFCCILN